MFRNVKTIFISAFSITWLFSLLFAPIAFAEEIRITGNGAASVNEVVVSNETTTQSEQTNSANIQNNVSTTSSTGNNDSFFNSGNATIQTGNAVHQTTVSNQANNSVVEVNNCCQNTASNITISGNGAYSQNQATINSQNNTYVDVYQEANIVNNVDTYASNGDNTASFNNGDSVVKTGSILAKKHIMNGPINLSYIKVPQGNNKTSDVSIIGNGFGSWNSVDLNEDSNTNISVVNAANIINDLQENYSTGDNKAKFTNGDNVIVTGDIVALTEIDNGPINVSSVKVDCDCEEKKPTKEKDKEEVPSAPVGGNIPPPSQITTSGPAPITSIPQAIVAAAHLPVTGNNWLVLALFGNIMMLLLGAYLRLRSGRSPGMQFSM